MEQIPEEELSIELLNARFNLAPFDSGDKDLNEFLKEDALEEQQKLLSKTHLCFYKNRVAGYITLSADSVKVRLPPKENGGKRELNLDQSQLIEDCNYPAYPCILIGRLASDKRLHEAGVGKHLLSFAVGFALDGPLGCRYLSFDPKQPKSLDPKKKTPEEYYTQFGFAYWTQSKRRMYLNMEEAAKQLQRVESLDLWSQPDLGPRDS
jgi:GNAT superfamily N-acetyltransferase